MPPYLIAFNKKPSPPNSKMMKNYLLLFANFAKLFAKNKPFPKMKYL